MISQCFRGPGTVVSSGPSGGPQVGPLPRFSAPPPAGHIGPNPSGIIPPGPVDMASGGTPNQGVPATMASFGPGEGSPNQGMTHQISAPSGGNFYDGFFHQQQRMESGDNGIVLICIYNHIFVLHLFSYFLNNFDTN